MSAVSLRAGDKSDQILASKILATHGHANHSFDAHPVLGIVQNIINLSTQVVDGIVQGTGQVLQEVSTDENFKSSNVKLPFCTLKAISSKLSTGSCKLACCGEVNISGDVAHDSTITILKKLSDYSWDAKAVLTMAAFALDYGEFWHLALPYDKSNHLAKPLAILKGVVVILKKPEYQLPNRRRRDIVDLNDLIKKTLDVIILIYDLEKLSFEHNKEVPELAKVILEYIPVAVYWAIRATLACVTGITIFLTKDHVDTISGDVDQLISSVQMINNVFNNLTNYHTSGKKQIERIKTQNSLWNLFMNPTRFRIEEVFQVMIFGMTFEKRINIKEKTTVNVDELKGKKVLWFISNVDVSDDYINKIIIPNVAKISKEIIEQYQIVWIPIVDEWTNEAKEKFDQLAKNKKWHAVRYFSTIAGIRFIEVNWQYKGKPMVVVTSQEGVIEYRNNSLVREFSIWEIIIKLGDKWFYRLAKFFEAEISEWMMDEKQYIFFYGGKDDTWVKQFKEAAETVAKEIGNIKLVSLSRCSSVEQFWSSVEEFFMSVSKSKQEDQHVILEVQRLLGFKNETGWAVLFKGSTVATSGHGSTMLQVLNDFDKWKEQVSKTDFETAFKEYQKKVVDEKPDKYPSCYRSDIKDGTEKDILNHALQCPYCSRRMAKYLSFQCCHKDVVE